jgi:hypothetical protein
MLPVCCNLGAVGTLAEPPGRPIRFAGFRPHRRPARPPVGGRKPSPEVPPKIVGHAKCSQLRQKLQGSCQPVNWTNFSTPSRYLGITQTFIDRSVHTHEQFERRESGACGNAA